MTTQNNHKRITTLKEAIQRLAKLEWEAEEKKSSSASIWKQEREKLEMELEEVLMGNR